MLTSIWTRRFGTAVAVLGITLVVTPRVAYAHPILDEAARLFGEAKFEESLEAYARAEQATDLTREELIELYINRSLVHHTLGDDDALRQDLFRLSTLEPNYEFSRQIPPVVREAFDEVSQPVSESIRIAIDASSHPGGVRIEARVENDLAAIVQEIRVGARTPGNAWTRRSNAPLEFPATSDQEIEFFAEAIGPGGAVLAVLGSPNDPQTASVEDLLARGARPDPDDDATTDPTPGGGVPAWPFIVGGSVVAAGLTVLLVVLLTSGGNENTILQRPIVDPPS